MVLFNVDFTKVSNDVFGMELGKLGSEVVNEVVKEESASCHTCTEEDHDRSNQNV